MLKPKRVCLRFSWIRNRIISPWKATLHLLSTISVPAVFTGKPRFCMGFGLSLGSARRKHSQADFNLKTVRGQSRSQLDADCCATSNVLALPVCMLGRNEGRDRHMTFHNKRYSLEAPVSLATTSFRRYCPQIHAGHSHATPRGHQQWWQLGVLFLASHNAHKAARARDGANTPCTKYRFRLSHEILYSVKRVD